MLPYKEGLELPHKSKQEAGENKANNKNSLPKYYPLIS